MSVKKLPISLTIILFIVSFFFPKIVFSQDSIRYHLETFGSVATGNTTPFWMVNNTYGVVPLKSNNAYLEGQLFYKHQFNKNLRFNAGIDLIGADHHSSGFFIQQLYGTIAYHALNLSVGPREQYNSMLDRDLSTGDFVYSTNARPIPEINLSIPEFSTVPLTKGILQFRGDFAAGKSFDNHYLLDTKAPGQDYAIDILWHHKSVFFKLEDPQKKFPFFLTFGFEDGAQWGGWTSYYNLGEMPHSFSDFMRVVLGKGGGSDAPDGEQMNDLGNHVGTYNLKLDYRGNTFGIAIYKQHYFDDNSGIEYANWRDGIWGMECSFYEQSYVKKIVLEYINTTDQSGPVHFLYYDKQPGLDIRGGGNDDYYNHLIYTPGWSYWGRTLGNALMTSSEYNGDGTLYLKNNRVKALHLGFDGNINSDFSYRLLSTGMYAWGRMSYPFLKKKTDFSTMAECNYSCPKWVGWKFGVQLAFDQGTLYRSNFGCSLKISKSGLIK